MFNKADEPVQVDGELVVYGFDDTIKIRAQEKADKKFVIRSEDLKKKYSVSKIGSSYSIWLPWDQIGEDRKEITLLPMFRGADGQVVRGESSENVLPGPKPKLASEREDFMKHFRQSKQEGTSQNVASGVSQNVASGVSPAAYEVDALSSNSGLDASRKMRSTSITLPRTMSDRMGLGTQPTSLESAQESSATQSQSLQHSNPSMGATSESSPHASMISATDPASRFNETAKRAPGGFRPIPVKPIRTE